MAGENTFYLEIITPDRQFYVGPAQSLILPAVDGQMGVEGQTDDRGGVDGWREGWREGWMDG